MAFPRKGSRSLVVDGVRYRWYLRHRPSYWQLIGHQCFSFAIERANPSGAILIVETHCCHPSNIVSESAATVFPADVARSIQAALAQGWQPTQSGKPFRMSAPQIQNRAEVLVLSAYPS